MPEEAQIDGLRGQRGMKVLQCLGVVRRDRSQVSRAPIAEDDVGLPVLRVVRVRAHDPTVAETTGWGNY